MKHSSSSLYPILAAYPLKIIVFIALLLHFPKIFSRLLPDMALPLLLDAVGEKLLLRRSNQNWVIHRPSASRQPRLTPGFLQYFPLSAPIAFVQHNDISRHAQRYYQQTRYLPAATC